MSNPQNCHLLWWVLPGVLAGMPMPFIHPERRLNGGGALSAYGDELPELYTAGVRAVVGLLNIPSDAAVFESAGFAFLCLPLPDGGAPTPEQAAEFVSFVDGQRQALRPVAVHCEAGLGRTGTMLALYLIAQGDTAEVAIRRVRGIEKAAVETPRQIQFLEQFAQQIQHLLTTCVVEDYSEVCREEFLCIGGAHSTLTLPQKCTSRPSSASMAALMRQARWAFFSSGA
jgi:atypical dual specificity phosphatase